VELVAADVECFHLGIAHLDAFLVGSLPKRLKSPIKERSLCYLKLVNGRQTGRFCGALRNMTLLEISS